MDEARGLDQSGTLERGLAVLEHVGRHREISTSAIAQQLGLSRSAAYRIVGTLKRLDYLEADRVTGRVRLGIRLAELGAHATCGDHPARTADDAGSLPVEGNAHPLPDVLADHL